MLVSFNFVPFVVEVYKFYQPLCPQHFKTTVDYILRGGRRLAIMRWAGVQVYIRQTHSWLTQLLVEGIGVGGGGLKGGQYEFRVKSSMSTWRIGSSRNDFIESGYGVDGGGSENKSKSIASHAVIAGQFEELIRKWGPETPQLLDAVQAQLHPIIVCRVLKKLSNLKAGRNFFLTGQHPR